MADPGKRPKSVRPILATRIVLWAAQLQRAIEELPEGQRQVILLVRLEGMS